MCPCVWSASPDAIVEVSFILTWTLTPSLQFEFCVNWDLTDVTNTWLSKRFVTKYLWLILIPLSLPWANSRGLRTDSILTPGQHEDGGWSPVEDRDKLWSGYINTSEVCRPEGRLAPYWMLNVSSQTLNQRFYRFLRMKGRTGAVTDTIVINHCSLPSVSGFQEWPHLPPECLMLSTKEVATRVWPGGGGDSDTHVVLITPVTQHKWWHNSR